MPYHAILLYRVWLHQRERERTFKDANYGQVEEVFLVAGVCIQSNRLG